MSSLFFVFCFKNLEIVIHSHSHSHSQKKKKKRVQENSPGGREGGREVEWGKRGEWGKMRRGRNEGEETSKKQKMKSHELDKEKGEKKENGIHGFKYRSHSSFRRLFIFSLFWGFCSVQVRSFIESIPL